jgi:hypothetical protein
MPLTAYNTNHHKNKHPDPLSIPIITNYYKQKKEKEKKKEDRPNNNNNNQRNIHPKA